MESKTEAAKVPHYFTNISSEKAYAIAAEKGLEVVLPNDDQLFIDIDNEDDFEAFAGRLARFDKMIRVVDNHVTTPSKSGQPGKYHIIVTLIGPVTPLERILFQFMLGSDRTRETLSYVRLEMNDPNPTLFYEKKVAAPDVVEDVFGDVGR